jgi:uncharacterized protein with von Willebrand factor type A (vWA) domain
MSTARSHISFWDYTKKSARNATVEFFRPLAAFGPERGKRVSRIERAADMSEQPAEYGHQTAADAESTETSVGRVYFSGVEAREEVREAQTRVAEAVAEGREVVLRLRGEVPDASLEEAPRKSRRTR